MSRVSYDAAALPRESLDAAQAPHNTHASRVHAYGSGAPLACTYRVIPVLKARVTLQAAPCAAVSTGAHAQTRPHRPHDVTGATRHPPAPSARLLPRLSRGKHPWQPVAPLDAPTQISEHVSAVSRQARAKSAVADSTARHPPTPGCSTDTGPHAAPHASRTPDQSLKPRQMRRIAVPGLHHQARALLCRAFPQCCKRGIKNENQCRVALAPAHRKRRNPSCGP